MLVESAKEMNRAGILAIPVWLQYNEVTGEKKASFPLKWRSITTLPPESELPNLFQKRHNAIAAVCGKISGNLEVLDFDLGGKYFRDWWEKIQSISTDLLGRLMIEKSRSGGYHVFYRCDAVTGNQQLAFDMILDVPTIAIETRGEGGLVFCAPSPGYNFFKGDFSTIPTITPDERKILLDAARSFNQRTEKICETPITTASIIRMANKGVNHGVRTTGYTPWDDFNERGINFIKAVLQKHGWAFVKQDGVNEHWRRPGKTAGLSASLGLHQSVFYVFSSNAAPFEANTGYSFFETFALLECGGDRKEATKQIAEEGFGDKWDETPVELPDFLDTPIEHLPPVPEVHSATSTGKKPESNFPPHLLEVPGFVGEVMEYFLKSAKCEQPVFALSTALAFQALLCSQRIRDNMDTRPNVYFFNLGESGCGKEFGRKIIKNVLEEVGDIKGIGYEPTKFFFEDAASFQGIKKELSDTGGILLWMWDEAGQDLKAVQKDIGGHRKGLLRLLTTLYTSPESFLKPGVKATKSDDFKVQQPHLSLLGTSTTGELMESFTKEAITNGLMGRLLFFESDPHATRKRPTGRLPVPQSLIDATKWWLDEPENRYKSPLVIPKPNEAEVTDEAEALFAEIDQECLKPEIKANYINHSFWVRAEEQARKFALLYAASRCKEHPIVDYEAAKWACDLMNFLILRKISLAILHIYEGEYDQQQKEIVKYILSQKNQCTKTMLVRRFRKFRAKELDELLKDMLENKKTIVFSHGRMEGAKKNTSFYAVSDMLLEELNCNKVY